eukprot:CAMPEP_0198216782 /NCGR_PEP_ID=MMETSP1445-20131203/59678_1 /TAXON_ID=36898 /ORGANISM="Pyramimonas sp., Strain CCMP2087" /LENGTH=430 /DNA_ID=CAMNT_0043893187 /DNA_START=167 /DNA_END=1456 /DNA_ORIENTATION=-
MRMARRGSGFDPGALPHRSFTGQSRFPARRLQTTSYLRKPSQEPPGTAGDQNLPHLRSKAGLPSHTLSVYSSCRPSTTPYPATRNPGGGEYSRLWTPKNAALAEEGEVHAPAQDPHVSSSQEFYSKPKLSPQVASRPRTQGGPLVPRTYLHQAQAISTKTLPGYARGPVRPAFKQAQTYSSPQRVPGPKSAFLDAPPTTPGPAPSFPEGGYYDSRFGNNPIGARRFTQREVQLQREVSFTTRVATSDATNYDPRVDYQKQQQKRFTNTPNYSRGLPNNGYYASGSVGSRKHRPTSARRSGRGKNPNRPESYPQNPAPGHQRVETPQSRYQQQQQNQQTLWPSAQVRDPRTNLQSRTGPLPAASKDPYSYGGRSSVMSMSMPEQHASRHEKPQKPEKVGPVLLDARRSMEKSSNAEWTQQHRRSMEKDPLN